MRHFLMGWLLVIVLMPFAAAGIYRMTEQETEMGQSTEDSGLWITVQTDGGERQLGVTDFLTGVVAGQIPADYEPETIKAQAILARTCLYGRAGDRTRIEAAETGLIWRSEEERRAQWGSGYEAANTRIMEAVSATEGRVLRYEGSLIVPAYFRRSHGRTRSSLEAWGAEVPWLQSVESPWDAETETYAGAAEETAENEEAYRTVVSMTRRQLIAALKKSVKDFDCAPDSLASSYQITETDSAGYVLQLQIGNKLLEGDDFRYALGLPSACFELDFDGNVAAITVYGNGHGVGFDQYGANRQAQEGKNCEELLLYYLTDVKVGE